MRHGAAKEKAETFDCGAGKLYGQWHASSTGSPPNRTNPVGTSRHLCHPRFQMRASLRRFIALLALAAVACLPAQGLHRGWLCECSGIVRAACCSICHDETDVPAACHHSHPEDNHGHHHEGDDHHTEDISPIDAASHAVTPGILPPVWICLWLPWLPDSSRGNGMASAISSPRPPPDPGGSRGQPHCIHRSVSLRI